MTETKACFSCRALPPIWTDRRDERVFIETPETLSRYVKEWGEACSNEDIEGDHWETLEIRRATVHMTGDGAKAVEKLEPDNDDS